MSEWEHRVEQGTIRHATGRVRATRRTTIRPNGESGSVSVWYQHPNGKELGATAKQAETFVPDAVAR